MTLAEGIMAAVHRHGPYGENHGAFDTRTCHVLIQCRNDLEALRAVVQRAARMDLAPDVLQKRAIAALAKVNP